MRSAYYYAVDFQGYIDIAQERYGTNVRRIVYVAEIWYEYHIVHVRNSSSKYELAGNR